MKRIGTLILHVTQRFKAVLVTSYKIKESHVQQLGITNASNTVIQSIVKAGIMQTGGVKLAVTTL